MNRMTIIIIFLCIHSFLFATGKKGLAGDASQTVYGATNIEAGMSFPPFADSSQIDFTLAEIKKLAINRIRIGMSWSNREPKQGQFHWSPMDLRMGRAAENNIKVFLTISSICPAWARLSTGRDGTGIINEEALRIFIETVLQRYPGIDKIQFGNEWEFGSERNTVYNDWESIQKFVTYTNILYAAVQKFSPDTQVVLGGLTKVYPMMEYFAQDGRYPDLSGLKLATGITEDFLKSKIDKIREEYKEKEIKQKVEWVLRHAHYDVLDVHLYDDPENWPEYLSVLPHDKPVVVSEFGGPSSRFEETSPLYQKARINCYIDAIQQLPITEAYYFKLVDSPFSYHKDTGLFYANKQMKPARDVFAQRLSASP